MKHRHEEGFSHAMTDLMAGVAVTFLLLATIFIMQAAQRREEERKKKEAAQAVVKKVVEDEPAKKALAELQRALPEGVTSETDPTDPLLLLILFQSEGWFAPAQCVPDRARVDEIRAKVRPVFEKVCDHRTFIRSIVLEGHTDREPLCKGAGGTSQCGAIDTCSPIPTVEEGFQNNVRLSAARAQEVFFKAREALVDSNKDLVASCIDPLFVVSGRGPVEPKDRTRKWRDDEKDTKKLADDRRVVLKVRFQSRDPLKPATP